MNNPLEANEFRFYLNFKDESLGFGIVEITEPIGFDASTFGVIKDANRYGRDVEYANVDIELTFQDVKTQLAENLITLPNGVVIDRLTMGLDFILFAIELKGFETEVEFIIKRNNLPFTIGVLDLASDIDTDMTTYLSCKVIQNTDKAIIKRRNEIKVDVFSNEDLDGNPVEPIQTYKVLMKAKPLFQVSEWENDKTYEFFDSDSPPDKQTFFNAGTILKRYDIENSYTVFTPSIKSNGTDMEIENNLKSIIPTTQLTNITVKLEFDGTFEMTQGVFNGAGRIFLGFSISDNNGVVEQLFTFYFDYWGSSQSNFTTTLNETYTEVVDLIESGKILTVYCNIFGNADCDIKATVRKWKLTISGTSTHVDSIGLGVRYIDLIKHTAKRVGGFDVISNIYSENYPLYNQFIFNGFMMRQFLTTNDDGQYIQIIKPLYSTWKDVAEQFVELNQDWQLIDDKTIFIGRYKDYYPNKDVGAFIQHIDSNYTQAFNEEYQLQGFNYKYQEYEQEKDQKNTLDAVHTESEWMLPNRQVEGIKTIEVPYIRDSYKIETIRLTNFRTDGSTSTSNDDSLIIVDCIESAENTTNTMARVFDVIITNEPSQLKILSDNTFNWMLLGFELGDYFPLVQFKIDGITYSFSGDLFVSKIEATLLTLDKNIGFPFDEDIVGNHNIFMTLEYPLTNVDYVFRTNEGFDLIENVSEPNTYPNLAYTIKRNMKEWESFIHTASIYHQEKIFKNTYWKSNGELITKLEFEAEPIKENESIKVSDLDSPVITPIIHNTTIICEYDKVLELLDKINEINPDGSIGGFIRIKGANDKLIKGYVKKLEYTWATKVMELEIEEKFDSDFTEILRLGDSLIQINKVGYDSDIVKPLEYKANGNFLQLFDKRGIPLNRPTHYSKYKVVGQEFENIIDLSKAIDEIW